jgi:hypothetical protein
MKCRLITKHSKRFFPTLAPIPEHDETRLWVDLFLSMEPTIDDMLYDYHSAPDIYPHYSSFLDLFLWLVDHRTTNLLNSRLDKNWG